jgi:hypothetical protein
MQQQLTCDEFNLAQVSSLTRDVFGEGECNVFVRFLDKETADNTMQFTQHCRDCRPRRFHSGAALLPLTLHSPRMPRKLPFYAPPMPRLRTFLICRRKLPEVVGAAAVKRTRFERDRALVKPTESLDACEYVLRGRENFSATRSSSAPVSSGSRALLRPVKRSAR